MSLSWLSSLYLMLITFPNPSALLCRSSRDNSLSVPTPGTICDILSARDETVRPTLRDNLSDAGP